MQGFNMGRYRPPENLDAALAPPKGGHRNSTTTSRANQSNSFKASPTVRFEMPFAIWCSTCPAKSSNALIGQGVRFNALKKRVGNYHSTPIWSFRMKHTACGGWLEMRTDPQNSDFVVTEGAARRDYGADSVVGERTGAVVLGGLSEDEARKRQDAFVAFEGKAAEKIKVKDESQRIDELRSLRERDWRDIDAAGARVRAAFRSGRRERDKDRTKKELVADSMGLGLDLLDANEMDQRRAELVEFGGVDDDGSGAAPFLRGAALMVNGSDARADKAGLSRQEALHRQLSNNTRAAVDPFATGRVTQTSRAGFLQGVKRKRDERPAAKETTDTGEGDAIATGQRTAEVNDTTNASMEPTQALVAYDSDD